MKNKKAFSLIEISLVLAIIGIMAAGIAQSAIFIHRTKLIIARGNTQNAPILEMTGLYAWWETTSQKSFDLGFQNTHKIANWHDLNSQALHRIRLFQIKTKHRPTYSQSAINGLPAISFDGNDFLKTVIDPTAIFATGSASIFIVYKPLNTLTRNFVLMQPFSKCSKNIEIGNSVHLQTGSFGINAGCGMATSSLSSSLTGGFPTLISFTALKSPIISGATSNIEIYKNGYPLTLVAEGAGGYNGAVGDYYATGHAPLFLGARNVDNGSKTDSYFTGKIGEIIIFNRSVENYERVLIEQYLANKWDLDVAGERH